MHETGIVKDLVRKIDAAARDAGAAHISAVAVWLGALSQFSPHHFEEHFEEEARGTRAEGARLSFEVSEDFLHPSAQHVVVQSVDLEV